MGLNTFNNNLKKRSNILFITFLLIIVSGTLYVLLYNRRGLISSKIYNKLNSKDISESEYYDYLGEYGEELSNLSIRYFYNHNKIPTYDEIQGDIKNSKVSCEVNDIEKNGNIIIKKCHVLGFNYNDKIAYQNNFIDLLDQSTVQKDINGNVIEIEKKVKSKNINGFKINVPDGLTLETSEEQDIIISQSYTAILSINYEPYSKYLKNIEATREELESKGAIEVSNSKEEFGGYDTVLFKYKLDDLDSELYILKLNDGLVLKYEVTYNERADESYTPIELLSIVRGIEL
ncbi:MAG: hypothetical protein K6G37_01680 [Bacilli bacterium]|nr:hypothetical protein [Bacilli bacterium]